jgi:Glycosyltransferase family 17
MRLVDTFLFSEPHEADVLWVKLNVEDHLVDEWIVVDNSYTYQGQYKGHHLKRILLADDRFTRFRPKLHLIETEFALDTRATNGMILDSEALQIERPQRAAAVPYLLAKYDDDDYVLISDVDECLDTEDFRRRRLLLQKLKAGGDIILVPRIRYWFDYDNRGLARRCTPLVSVRQVKRDSRLNHYRERGLMTPVVWKRDVIFEYSYCFSRDKIMRKFDTFGHTGFEQPEVDAALRYNQRPTSRRRERQLDWSAENWFVKRNLNSRNSPAFVREHLAELKTNVVSVEYKRNRLDDYPQYFPRNRAKRFIKWASLYGRMYSGLIKHNTSGYVGPARRFKARTASLIRRGVHPD